MGSQVMRVQSVLNVIIELDYFNVNNADMKTAINNAFLDTTIGRFASEVATESYVDFLGSYKDFDECIRVESGSDMSEEDLYLVKLEVFKNWDRRDAVFQNIVENGIDNI